MQSSTSPTPLTPNHASRIFPTVGGRYFALAVLFCMNLLNYVDRYSFFAVGSHIQRDLKINDEGYGVLSASFMIVYTIVSPLIGWLGDRYNRRVLLACGVGIWSLATVGTAFSQGFPQMFCWRALLGVGEASYGVIAPALLSDLFEPRERGRIMGLYYLALPLGGGLGIAIGGWVAHVRDWRAAFWVVGLPGLAAALAGLLICDPGRGASEGLNTAGKKNRPKLRDYLALFRNRSYLYNTAGMAAVTFTSGALAAWGPTFYQSVRGMNSAQAGAWLGGMTFFAGLIGIVLGTGIAELLLKWTRRAYLLLAGAAVLIATPFGTLGLLDPNRFRSIGLLFVAMLMTAAVLGPCNTVTANVVPPNRRAAGFALSIFLIHLFGDIASPILIGKLSLWFGDPAVAESPVGQLLALIGASPRDGKNLLGGMLSVVPILVLGCVFYFLGSRHLAEDQDRARQEAGGDGWGETSIH